MMHGIWPKFGYFIKNVSYVAQSEGRSGRTDANIAAGVTEKLSRNVRRRHRIYNDCNLTGACKNASG
jgi:hypothetical protein